MYTLLLVIIFTVFIGRGIPDSLFGSAWPAISEDLGLPVSYANAVTIITTLGIVVSSLLSPKIINKFGTAAVVVFSSVLSAVALLGFYFSGNFLFLCICAFPLGFGAGLIDFTLNNYVALCCGGKVLNFLHCSYGLGALLSPYFMSIGIRNGNWHNGYLFAFILQSVIAIIAIASFPLWKKFYVKKEETKEVHQKMSFFGMFKNSSVRKVLILVLATNGIESVIAIWGSTYLVGARNVAAEDASFMMVFYFLGLTISRFTAGLFSGKISDTKIIYICCGMLFIPMAMIFIPFSSVIMYYIIFFLFGLGNSAIYPNILHMTPDCFGVENSQSVMSAEIAFAYGSGLFIPPIFGLLAQYIGVNTFSLYLLALYAALVISTMTFMRSINKNKIIKTID